MSEYTLRITIKDKQIKRLNFLIDTFHPELKKMIDSQMKKYIETEKSINKIFNDALHKYYKEVLGNINQGNEHEGLPLIEEIYD